MSSTSSSIFISNLQMIIITSAVLTTIAFVKFVSGANTLSKMSIARLDNGEYADSNTENLLEDKHYYNIE
nr:5770_t:CDS:2 [Entrophospora candida]